MNDKTMTPEMDELLNEAFNPTGRTFDLFGKIEFRVWAGAFEKGVRGAVPYDPNRHERKHVMIDLFIQPLPEIDVKYPKSLEYHDTNWSKSWTQFVLPSLKALGVNNANEIDGRWARVARVPTGDTYEKKDQQGNPTGEIKQITTFKFVELYDSEDACRAAWQAAGGARSDGNGNGNGHTPAPVSKEDSERATALQFLQVIVQNAVRGIDKWDEAKAAVTKALEQYPSVTKFFDADSPETADLMTKNNDKLLPF